MPTDDSRKRTRTATLQRRQAPSTQICMDFGEAVRHESLPLMQCVRCGLEFGAASFVDHQRTCNSGSRDSSSDRRVRKRAGAVRESPKEETKTSTGAVARRGGGGGGEKMAAAITTLDPPPAGVKLFGSPCKFCGERFTTNTLRLHLRQCRKAKRTQKMYTLEQPSDSTSGGHTPIATDGDLSKSRPPKVSQGELVCRDKTPHHVQLELQLHRPRTQSLDRSILLDRGLTLPSISTRGSVTQCRECGEVISTEGLTLHRQTCKPSPRTVARGEIVFPSLSSSQRSCVTTTTNNTPNSPRVGQNFRPSKVTRKPPTVVCYICGKEYGTRSISIHEPQCLNRFEIDNRKLPVNERKPLPKKSITRDAAPLSLQRALVETYRSDVLHDVADQYFQYCYQEWERDLIPCKKCGRKFAPERHVKHSPKCNAEPLTHTTHFKRKN